MAVQSQEEPKVGGAEGAGAKGMGEEAAGDWGGAALWGMRTGRLWAWSLACRWCHPGESPSGLRCPRLSHFCRATASSQSLSLSNPGEFPSPKSLSASLEDWPGSWCWGGAAPRGKTKKPSNRILAQEILNFKIRILFTLLNNLGIWIRRWF